MNHPSKAAIAALALLSACDPFGRDARFEIYLDDMILGADDIAVSGDAVYLRLSDGKRLERVRAGGSYGEVSLEGAAADRVIPVPGADQDLLVFASWPVCTDDSDKIVYVSDCNDDDLETRHELARINGNRRVDATPIGGHLNSLTFSDDGTLAVAWFDWREGTDIQVNGIADLTEVLFVPLDGGDARGVSIGFTPSRILFTHNSAGVDDRAVVLSESKVVVVDLETLAPEVSFPLTQDLDASVVPLDAVVSEDGDTVLLSVEGSADLYKLDLLNYSIDVEDLDAQPSHLTNVTIPGDTPTAATLVAYAGLAQVDLLSHNTWEVLHSIQLEEPVNASILGEGSVLLYSTGQSQDVYLLDLSTRNVTEFRTATPILEMMQSESDRYAVATLRPGGSNSGSEIDAFQSDNYGLSVIDLEEGNSASLVLGAEPVGVALVDDDETTYALLLPDGADTLLQVDLRNPTAAIEIDLPAPPTAIAAMADGRFAITHASALGLVSFLDPATLRIKEAHGFAASTVWTDEETELPRRSTGN